MPVEAEFCLITFTLLPSPFLNATSLALRNAANWPSTATTFVAPRLARSNAWYDAVGSWALDVTDNIYIGARPGHNQQARRREERSILHAHMHTCARMHVCT